MNIYLRFIRDPEVGEDDHEGQEELEAELREAGAAVTRAVTEAELGLAWTGGDMGPAMFS